MMDKEYILYADKMLNNIVSFNNKWDMEPCYKELKFKSWILTKNKDNEWLYMLSRGEYLNKLLIAYDITKDKKYIDKYYELVDDWYKYNIPRMNTNDTGGNISFKKKVYNYLNIQKLNIIANSRRPLDVSIRLFAIANDLLYLKKLNIIDKEYLNKVKNNSIKIINYLLYKYLDEFNTNNWGIIILSNILYTMNVLNIEEKEIYKDNYKRLISILDKQINKDGFQIENTYLYHIEIMIYLSYLILETNDKTLKKYYTKMAEFIYKIKTNDNEILAISDSDQTELSEIMYMNYLVLKDDKYLNSITSKLNKSFTCRFLYKDINKIKSKLLINKEDELFKDSKMYVHKDDKTYLCITNNDINVSHRHSDNGSFMLYKNSKGFFIDSGRYTYKDNRKRKYLKSMYAHNTIIVDDIESFKYIDSFNYKKNISNCNIDRYKKNIIRVEYTINNIKISRYFVILDEGIIVVNKVNTDDKIHSYKIMYNLDKNIKIKKNKNTFELSNDNEKVYLSYTGKYKIKNSYYSKRYNSISENKKIILYGIFKKELINYQIILYDNIKYTIDNNIVKINNKTIDLNNLL